MQPERYAVYVNWTWGRQSRFQEEYKFTVPRRDEAEIKSHVRSFAASVARRYCFDCGQRDMPMRPHINSVRIVPEFEAETFYGEDWTQNEVFADYYIANPPDVRFVPPPACVAAVAALVDAANHYEPNEH